jgi:20S proteasome alpha/beta subunit
MNRLPVLPLPKKTLKPYIHPDTREHKAMTIGVAFDCMDGIIMGADRQMTAPGWHKYSEKKLFYDVKDDRILALIGGDELGLAKEFWWELLEHSIADYDSCKQGLMDVLDRMGRLNTELPLQFICGIATKKTTHLFGFRGKGVYPIMDELGVICAGDSSLIRYLSKNIELFWQSLGDGVATATYLLKRAEEFVDGCHGPMDVIVLRPGPRINTFDPAMIEELDKRLADNHGKVFRELLSLSPPFSIGP